MSTLWHDQHVTGSRRDPRAEGVDSAGAAATDAPPATVAPADADSAADADERPVGKPDPAGLAPGSGGGLGQGLAAAAVGVLLALLSVPGAAVLTVGVGVLQVLLALTVLVVLDAPGRRGAVAMALAAAAVGDVVVLRGHGKVDGLSGVVAVSLVSSLLYQLSRRTARTQVTLSLVDTVLAVVLGAGAACLLAARHGSGGRATVLAALLAAAACLSSVRLGRAGAGVRVRSRFGLLIGLVAGGIVGAVVGAVAGDPTAGRGALLGLACAAVVAVADRLVARSQLPAGAGRRTAALRPVTVLLPYALLGPVALLAGRLAVG